MEISSKIVLGKELITYTPTDPTGWITNFNEDDPEANWVNYDAGKRLMALAGRAKWAHEISDAHHEENVMKKVAATEAINAANGDIEEPLIP